MPNPNEMARKEAETADRILPGVKHVYLLNGPPRAGKDTAGEMLAEMLPKCRVDKFARILKEMVHRAFDVQPDQSYEEFIAGTAAHDHFEDRKDQPAPELGGAIPRAAYIAMSEKLVKPLCGTTYFADRLVEQWQELHETPEYIVVTDCGFQLEVDRLIELMGSDRCTVVQIHRQGCTFDGDSRQSVDGPGINGTFRIHNDGKPSDMRQTLLGDIGLPEAVTSTYTVEVLLPTMDGDLEWFTQAHARDSIGQARAVAESLRRDGYGGRYVRITAHGQVVALALPGDKPLADFGDGGSDDSQGAVDCTACPEAQAEIRRVLDVADGDVPTAAGMMGMAPSAFLEFAAAHDIAL